jgi:hypothetical protein
MSRATDDRAAERGRPAATAYAIGERTVRLLVAVAAMAVCAAGAVIVLAGVHSPARPYVVLVGLVLGTGWAVVGWLSLPSEAAYAGALVLGVGVSVPIAVSILLVLSHWWHPVGVSGALLAVAAGVNGALIVRTILRRPSPAHRAQRTDEAGAT